MKLKDSLSLAFRTVKSNKLRTGITVAIIGFGIMALIGIITATTSMNQSLKESFATMGVNSFSIHYRDRNVRIGGGGSEVQRTTTSKLKAKKSNERKIITYRQAKLFKERYSFPSRVSISVSVGNVIVNNDKVKTNPNISLHGGDENYLLLNGYSLVAGRSFNKLDVQSGKNICILGNSVAKTLYGSNLQQAVDKIVKVGGIKYRVIGVLENKGSSSFMNADNIVLTTYNNVRRIYPTENTTFNIGVMISDINQMGAAIAEAKATLRPIRNLNITEADNFYISKSDSIAEAFINSLGAITTAAAFIGLITLFAAAVGLMNIMLVAVNERTREIGLIKAIGGKASSVKAQFLFESIFISLLGAIIGIILGIIVGNVVGIFLQTSFVIPWAWAAGGVIVCSAVGLFAGLYPAIKAANLNPINALRYE